MEGAALKYLLDTSVWINAALTPAVLPGRILRLLESSESKALSSISLLETTILFRRNRLPLVGQLPEFFTNALPGIELIDLSPQIALGIASLPPSFHGDPFDRTIVATAATLNLTLITADAAIRDADACSVVFFPYKPSRAP